VAADGTETTFAGEAHGRMAAEPAGDGGFGYDPVFIAADDPQLRTMAQLSPAEKDAISHRGRAVAGLRAWLAG
jgi:XTP/dITP diphosphohydrolase